MKWIILFASGCWMIGEGLRMAVMAIFYKGQGWSYFPNAFDLFFDWLPLVILGSFIFLEAMAQFYQSRAEKDRSSKANFSLTHLFLVRIHR
jgi:hypothetical protein